MKHNFVLLVAGQAISNMGDYLLSATLLIWVFSLVPSTAAVSGVTVAQFLPILLIGPIAGIFVDRWNRRQTMIIANLGQAAATLLPFIVPGVIRLPAIYVSVFLIFACGTLATPAMSGLLQAIVDRKQLPQAISLSQVAFAVSAILGSLLATPLYIKLGPTMALLIDALSFLASVLCLYFVQAPKEALHPYAFRQEQNIVSPLDGIFNDLVAGFRFIASTRILLILCIIVLMALFGAGALGPLGIVFISKHLHANTALSGLMSSGTGMGVLIGLMGAGLLARRIALRYLFIGSVFLLGVGLIVYSFQTVFLVALIVNFIIGLQQGGIQVSYLSILMDTTPKTMIGRVQSVIQMCVGGMGLVSAGLGGYLGQFLPVNLIFTGCGILVMFAGSLGWFALRKVRENGQAA